LTSTFRRARDEEQVENQQRHPDIDRCVSDIKDEEVTPESMQIEIIDDGSMRNAINRIAEGAADNQPKPHGGQHGLRSNQPPHKQTGRRQGNREQSVLARRRVAGEQTKRLRAR
jgi:hypothetical protein